MEEGDFERTVYIQLYDGIVDLDTRCTGLEKILVGLGLHKGLEFTTEPKTVNEDYPCG